jgi:hypothetical protein
MMAGMSSAKGRALGAAGAPLPLASEFRIARSQQRYTERWRHAPVEPGGQAVTTPPDPRGRVMYGCPPEQLIRTYNHCMRGFGRAGTDPWAYLFWGAEYWLRQQHGDPSYLEAFTRILDRAREDGC